MSEQVFGLEENNARAAVGHFAVRPYPAASQAPWHPVDSIPGMCGDTHHSTVDGGRDGGARGCASRPGSLAGGPG